LAGISVVDQTGVVAVGASEGEWHGGWIQRLGIKIYVELKSALFIVSRVGWLRDFAKMVFSCSEP
jgi:hypothetical protein